MPKAQVLVTVTAEALIEVPSDVADVEAYCREHVAMAWGDLRVESMVQSPAVTVEHYILPEPEPEAPPEPEPASEPAPALVTNALEDADSPATDGVAATVAHPSPDDTLPLPVLDAAAVESSSVVELFDDPAYESVIRSAVRERAERLIQDIVEQVVAELEPLLRRHLDNNLRGAP